MREKLASFFRSDPGAGKRSDGTTVFWIIASTSATLLLMGWLLPWVVNAYSAGGHFGGGLTAFA